MKKLLFSAAALALLAAGPVSAAPSYCTGTVLPVASGGGVPGSFLLTGTASSGNCVEAGDKVFGAFSVNGAITGAGSSVFSFVATPSDVTIGFQGIVGPGETGGVDYTVAVDPAVSGGFLIDDLQKDLTLNAVPDSTGPGFARLTGFTDPASIAFDCTRTVNPAGGTCPETGSLAFPVSQMSVSETVTTDNAIVTALTDTISQVPTAVPEPNSLALLAGALLGLGWARRRHGVS